MRRCGAGRVMCGAVRALFFGADQLDARLTVHTINPLNITFDAAKNEVNRVKHGVALITSLRKANAREVKHHAET
jgi:hypothetical protein